MTTTLESKLPRAICPSYAPRAEESPNRVTANPTGALMRLTGERIGQLQSLMLVRLRRPMQEHECLSTVA
jgi:hypothetical protein